MWVWAKVLPLLTCMDGPVFPYVPKGVMLCLSPAWSWRSRTTADSYLSAWNERGCLLLETTKFGSSGLGKIPPVDPDFPGFGYLQQSQLFHLQF